MQLTYTSPTKTLVQVVLNAGENLGDYNGPVTAYVSVSNNRTYREIIDTALQINDPLQIASAPPPVNTTAPVCSPVSGGLQPGGIVSCTPGAWNPSGVITRQWMSGGAPVSGQNGTSYTIRTQDIGNLISCIVFCTNAGGSAQMNSNSLGPILDPGTTRKRS